ncbi:MAG: peptidyl-prolyl cis-trans isomerase [Agathobacter sp.]|nr:peptidyl-prolyl cis-trans isomerase [Agathobacter sp.]
MGKRKIKALGVVLGLVTLLCGCQIGDTQFVFQKNTANKKEVFTLNGEACSLTEAKLYLSNYRNIYGNAYGIELWGYDFGEDSLEEYIKEVTIDELTRIACMEQIAKSQELELTEEEEKKIKEMAEIYYDSLSEEEISYIGASKKNIESYYESYALAQKLYDSLTQNINIEVSDDEARVIRIQQIYVTNANNASAVNQKLTNGEDFAAVASNYNEAAVVETTVARGTLPEAVEEIAFNLDNDAVSGMIESDGGYYFIKCLNKFEEELTEANKANIIVKREKAQFEDAYLDFTEKAEYDLNEELWESVAIAEEETITTDSFFEVFEENW